MIDLTSLAKDQHAQIGTLKELLQECCDLLETCETYEADCLIDKVNVFIQGKQPLANGLSEDIND